MDDQLRRRSVGAPATRSVLLTILGEYVLHAPDGVWQETLIGALGAMGYKTHAARQALVRSVSAGWLTAERHGRHSRLYLTEEAAEMLRAGAERIYSFGAPWEWEGRWLLVVVRVPEQHREARHVVRTRLAWAGFGSLGNGLWITPHVEREGELLGVADGQPVAELLSFRAELGVVGEPAKVVADAWDDLHGVATAYWSFISRFGRMRPRTPEAVFRAQTDLVHQWRKFPFLDPDLPEQMLPSKWPRSKAYGIFKNQHAAWHPVAQEYFSSLEGLGGSRRRRRAA